MFSTFLSFSLLDVLPLIKNRGEATALITVIILAQQLSSSTRALHLSVENELLLMNLQRDTIEGCRISRFNVALCPIIFNATALVKSRFQPQVAAVNSLLEDLCRIKTTIRTFSEQNVALAREFESAGCTELSSQKLSIANFELEICRRIEVIKSLSTEAATREMFESMTDSPLVLNRIQNLRHVNDADSQPSIEKSDHYEPFSVKKSPRAAADSIDNTGASAKKKRLLDTGLEDGDTQNRSSPYFTTSTSSPLFTATQRGNAMKNFQLFSMKDDDCGSIEKNPVRLSDCDELEFRGSDNIRISGIQKNLSSQNYFMKGTHTKITDDVDESISHSDEWRKSMNTSSDEKCSTCNIPTSDITADNIENNMTNGSSSSSRSVSGSGSRSGSGSKELSTYSDDAPLVDAPVIMSPPPEALFRDISTPTSSQTAFIGDHEESSGS